MRLCVAWLPLLFPAAGMPQTQPPVRQIGPIVAVASVPLSSVASVRQLSDGRVYAADNTAHRLLLFDASLKSATTVLDSTGDNAHRFPSGDGRLLARRGDSTWLLDRASLGYLTFGNEGRAGPLVALPRPGDVNMLMASNQPGGAPDFDAEGRLVYSGSPITLTRTPTDPPIALLSADSVPLVRVDARTRLPDTITFVRVPRVYRTIPITQADGTTINTPVRTPVPEADDWVVTPTGEIAIVRVADLHVDWVSAAGSMTALPKIAFDWQRLTDSAKTVLLDSARADYAAHPARGSVRVNGATRSVPTAAAPVTPDQLPDYLPPFRPRSALADADGNIWVQIAMGRSPDDQGPVFDVISREGVLVDRVQIPKGAGPVGFGPGVVYLTSREANGVILVRRRIH